MTCSHCGIAWEHFPKEYVDLDGLPKYYWNTRQTSTGAEAIFCSPHCSNKWYASKEIKQ